MFLQKPRKRRQSTIDGLSRLIKQWSSEMLIKTDSILDFISVDLKIYK